MNKFDVEFMPKLSPLNVDPTSSLMHALLRDSNLALIDPLEVETFSDVQCLVPLLDNFRMTEPLCRSSQSRYPGLVFQRHCTSRIVFRPEIGSGGDVVIDALLESAAAGSGRICLSYDPSISNCSFEAELNHQARQVCRVIQRVVACTRIELQDRQQRIKSVFVVTPRRAQRAITESLVDAENLRGVVNVESSETEREIQVDTVERMQGQEADVVIVCCASFNAARAEGDLGFLFDPNRLNVAFSRARFMCILLVSPFVITPSLSLLGSKKMIRANQYMQDFRVGASCATIMVTSADLGLQNKI